jgi:hypothetical protein
MELLGQLVPLLRLVHMRQPVGVAAVVRVLEVGISLVVPEEVALQMG